MARQATSALRASIVASGLLTPEELAAAEEVLRAAPHNRAAPPQGSDRELADYLQRSGRLNRWQIQQLSAGRTKFNLGPYHVIDSIGQGGMGQVFKAEHTVMGRIVAVKVLPRDRSTDEAIEAFHREIRAQAQLDHENLVRALDAGHDGNVHYLVTEYVPGMDLRKIVRAQGRLSESVAAAVIVQAAHGLAHAHGRGIIHRDVKPGNLLVTRDGRVKVSDLGLADFFQEANFFPGTGFFPGTVPGERRRGKIVGTADYLAPEQIITPDNVTPVSDIYSLGCTLYYAVTGKVPFPGGTTSDKCRAHCHLQPLDPRRLNASLNAEFVDVIADMMEKSRERRIADAGEVARRLAAWAGDNPAAVVRTLGDSEPEPPRHPVAPPVIRPSEPTGDTEDDIPFDPVAPERPRRRDSQPSQTTHAVSSAEQETIPVLDSQETVSRWIRQRHGAWYEIPFALRVLIILGSAAVLTAVAAIIAGLLR